MEPERWQKIEALFQSAIALSLPERSAFLAHACQGDDTLRREVEALLAADQNADEVTLNLPAQVAAEMISQPAVWQSGQTLNHYTIVSQLGAGGMGVVYLAQDTRLRRKVALKVLPAALAQDEGRLRRFEQEALAASALNHPNILTIHEFETAEATRFLASEFIDGETLRAHLQRAPLSINEALDISTQIAQALAAAHDAHIVHRDIKPENVMLRKDGIVKVLDFGLAKLTERHGEGAMEREGKEADTWLAASPRLPVAASHSTTPGLVMGTVRYMSPEQARGEQVDARTDIFSLGIVLYEMIAGRTPFAGATMEETIDAILHHEPLPLLDAPAGLQAIVQKALQKDRAQRYASSREMLAALEQLREEWKLQARLQSIPTGALPGLAETKPDAHTPRILSAIKRHKVSVGAALIVVVAVLAGGAFGLYRLLRSSALPGNPPVSLKVTPLTAFPGLESKPSFSPDGNQVAFSWGGEGGDNTDIYIKEIGGEGMRRLTTHPGIDSDAVWSPDGRAIAFFRITEEGGAIYVMPMLGGVERKLTDISPLRPVQVLRGEMSWSPDGKTLVFPDRNSVAEPLGLTTLNLETGEKRSLLAPLPSSTGDYSPVFSPDGKTIAFNRSIGGEPERDIYVIPATGGTPEKITAVNTFLTSVDWLPDGKSLIYCASGATREQAGVWRVMLDNRSVERVAGREVDRVWGIVTDRQTGKMIWIKADFDLDIWRIGLRNGKTDTQFPAKFLASTETEVGVRYSPDGKKIAILSDRSGETQAWVADADGQNLKLFSNDRNQYEFPTWSPDGKMIATDSLVAGKHAITLMNAESGQRTPLVQDTFNNIAPNWSADGNWIYFGSDRGGEPQLWKVPATGGKPDLAMKQRLIRYAESWDGKALIYSKGYMVPGLWRYDFSTQTETLLTKVHNAGYWHSWDITQRGIYFATCETPLRAMVEFYDFVTGNISLVAKLKTPFPAPLYGLSVSPDEKWLCYMQQDLTGDLLLMENVQ
ncbi:MAG: serine/threonine-protein kinase [Blastocatellia bacterium]|nr:serine/threonine-protein kinase [Blastocatellia bacterium]